MKTTVPERQQLTNEEKQQIQTLSADGWSVYRIAKSVNRSPHTIKNFLSKPEVVKAVRNEKSELAEVYRQKARNVVESISATDIANVSLQQKSISSGILLDKSLLLAGDGPLSIHVNVLLDLASMIRRERDEPLLLRELPHPTVPLHKARSKRLLLGKFAA